MAEQSSAGQASPPSDPFAAAKTNLRETIKWLTTSFAALAAAVLAGSPWTGIGSLEIGQRFWIAVGAAAIGFACIVAAIVIAISLLRSESFFVDELVTNERLRTLIDSHADAVLPPQYPTIRSLLDARKQAIGIIRSTAGEPARADTYSEAERAYSAIDSVLVRLTSFGHFEKMSQALTAKAPVLIGLSVFAVIGLAVFAWAANPAKRGFTPTHADAEGLEIELPPSDPIVKGIREACGIDSKVRGVVVREPLSDWAQIVVTQPHACEGLRVLTPKLSPFFAAPAK